jgi:hypothetical protein
MMKYILNISIMSNTLLLYKSFFTLLTFFFNSSFQFLSQIIILIYLQLLSYFHVWLNNMSKIPNYILKNL